MKEILKRIEKLIERINKIKAIEELNDLFQELIDIKNEIGRLSLNEKIRDKDKVILLEKTKVVEDKATKKIEDYVEELRLQIEKLGWALHDTKNNSKSELENYKREFNNIIRNIAKCKILLSKKNTKEKISEIFCIHDSSFPLCVSLILQKEIDFLRKDIENDVKTKSDKELFDSVFSLEEKIDRLRTDTHKYMTDYECENIGVANIIESHIDDARKNLNYASVIENLIQKHESNSNKEASNMLAMIDNNERIDFLLNLRNYLYENTINYGDIIDNLTEEDKICLECIYNVGMKNEKINNNLFDSDIKGIVSKIAKMTRNDFEKAIFDTIDKLKNENINLYKLKRIDYLNKLRSMGIIVRFNEYSDALSKDGVEFLYQNEIENRLLTASGNVVINIRQMLGALGSLEAPKSRHEEYIINLLPQFKNEKTNDLFSYLFKGITSDYRYDVKTIAHELGHLKVAKIAKAILDSYGIEIEDKYYKDTLVTFESIVAKKIKTYIKEDAMQEYYKVESLLGNSNITFEKKSKVYLNNLNDEAKMSFTGYSIYSKTNPHEFLAEVNAGNDFNNKALDMFYRRILDNNWKNLEHKENIDRIKQVLKITDTDVNDAYNLGKSYYTCIKPFLEKISLKHMVDYFNRRRLNYSNASDIIKDVLIKTICINAIEKLEENSSYDIEDLKKRLMEEVSSFDWDKIKEEIRKGYAQGMQAKLTDYGERQRLIFQDLDADFADIKKHVTEKINKYCVKMNNNYKLPAKSFLRKEYCLQIFCDLLNLDKDTDKVIKAKSIKDVVLKKSISNKPYFENVLKRLENAMRNNQDEKGIKVILKECFKDVFDCYIFLDMAKVDLKEYKNPFNDINQLIEKGFIEVLKSRKQAEKMIDEIDISYDNIKSFINCVKGRNLLFKDLLVKYKEKSTNNNEDRKRVELDYKKQIDKNLFKTNNSFNVMKKTGNK